MSFISISAAAKTNSYDQTSLQSYAFRVKHYSAERFKNELLSNTFFDHAVMVTGNVDLSRYIELTALPNNLTVQGNLNLSGCSGIAGIFCFSYNFWDDIFTRFSKKSTINKR